MNEIKFKFKGDKLSEFKNVLVDLVKINHRVKMKINEDGLLLYTVESVGENSEVSQASATVIKSHIFPKTHFFVLDANSFDEDDEAKENIDWIIKDATVFIKKISFFDGKSDVFGTFSVKKDKNSDNYFAFSVMMKDSRFKFSITGDEIYVIRDLSIDALEKVTDSSLIDISFTVPTSEFKLARQASAIDSDEDIISIEVNRVKGFITMKQDSWELKLAESNTEEERRYIFHKKYLKNITPDEDEIHFKAYERFLLFKENNQAFMVGYEKSY